MSKELSPAQQRALEVLQTKGWLFAYNGVSIRTVRALERAGLCTVETKRVRRDYRTSEYRRDHQDLDWSARLIEKEN